jgi:hypothetical protein
MTSRVLLKYSLVALTTIAVAGCVSAPRTATAVNTNATSVASPTVSSTPTTAPPVGVVTRDASAETISYMALIRGILRVHNGCVVLEGGTIPVFPEDEVTWDGTTLTYRGTMFIVGDTIDLGGGLSNRDAPGRSIPSECGDGSVWGVGSDTI